jgi:hypothetical protein
LTGACLLSLSTTTTDEQTSTATTTGEREKATNRVSQGGSAPKGDDGCTRVEAGGGWVERGEREIEERDEEGETR